MLLGYFFAPITWLMGIPWNEAIVAGELAWN
jgi:nucleoside permease NupC